MDSSRRGFIQSAGVLAATSLIADISNASTYPEVAAGEVPYSSRLPIVQGATDATSATFVVLKKGGQRIFPHVRDQKGRVLPHTVIDDWFVPGTQRATLEFQVNGLTPGVDYTLYLLNDSGRYVDKRTFRSLNTEKAKSRFATASCMNDLFASKSVSMWQSLAQENCDFVILLGDTCYADSNTDGSIIDISRRYVQTRLGISWFKLSRLIPTLAVWDDHDFGANNANKHFDHAPYTRTLFRKFWGQSNTKNWRRGHGVGGVFAACGQRFYLLDGRSYRDPSGTRLGRHLGESQMEWMLEDLKVSKRPAWLMSGSQFFGGYMGKESYEGDHPNDFKNLLGKLSRVDAPVCFASGDVHFSEMMKIEPEILGYTSVEYTSSSMHSFSMPGSPTKKHNPRRLAHEWRHNYTVFDVGTDRQWEIKNRCVVSGGKTSFSGRAQIARG